MASAVPTRETIPEFPFDERAADLSGPASRRRSAQRRRIYFEAGKLFDENGGEAGNGHDVTMVEQIASRSDISVRTFFRYFRSKTDVIYVDLPATLALHLGWTEHRLKISPPALAALEASLIQLTYTMADSLDFERVKRALSSETFQTRRGTFKPAWRRGLAKLLWTELPKTPDRDLRASVTASVALEVQEFALHQWYLSGWARDIIDCIDDALQAIRWAAATGLPDHLETSLNVGTRSAEMRPADRRRATLRRRIIQEAGEMFQANGGEEDGGHDKTTVDEIAERSDISVRTFFRYFQSKTDVIYLDTQHTMAEHLELAQLWLTRKAPGEALLTASLVQISDHLADPFEAIRYKRALASPIYIERSGAFRRSWNIAVEELVKPALRKSKQVDLQATAIAGLTLEIREIALERWAAAAGAKDISVCFDETIRLYREVIEEILPKKMDPSLDYRNALSVADHHD